MSVEDEIRAADRQWNRALARLAKRIGKKRAARLERPLLLMALGTLRYKGDLPTSIYPWMVETVESLK